MGSALYGAASVGGSVNLETSPFTETPRVSAAISYGSFETKRLMLESLVGIRVGRMPRATLPWPGDAMDQQPAPAVSVGAST